MATQEVAELRRQIAIEQAAKKKKTNVYDADVPTEFECCYCTTKVFDYQPNAFEFFTKTMFNYLSICVTFCIECALYFLYGSLMKLIVVEFMFCNSLRCIPEVRCF